MNSLWFRLSFVVILALVLVLFFNVPVETLYYTAFAIVIAVIARYFWCKKKNLEFISGKPIS